MHYSMWSFSVSDERDPTEGCRYETETPSPLKAYTRLPPVHPERMGNSIPTSTKNNNFLVKILS